MKKIESAAALSRKGCPPLFKINGVEFAVGIVSISRTFRRTYKYEVTTIDGENRTEIKATYPVYTITIGALNQADYDALFEAANQPLASQPVTVPYNQTTLTFDARISVSQDAISMVDSNGSMRWDGMVITMEGVKPL